ncbi:hypothetical protein OPQ81_007373 [Rhizoctonia solani]|nr:hypothetical protein OPQ81_007373 [Rhizoctonia solani]
MAPTTSAIMGTRGFMAYRHKGKYYRIYLKFARPDSSGVEYASQIPQDPIALEDWIKRITHALEDKKKRVVLFDWQNHEIGTGCNWTLGDLSIDWTYVIDFDNRVFTVNGAVHFPFDSMPPLHSSDSEPGFAEYFEWEEMIKIPTKYLTSIDLWPAPPFDTAQAQRQYKELQPLIAPPSEWGSPTWDSLTVSQRLSTCIAKTLVHDYSEELALAHYSSVWHKLGLFCWQVANVAAPSHLICPPLDATPQDTVLYVRTDLIKEPRAVRIIHLHMGGKGTLGRYCWFRGCLITFCPRLDQPAYMMHQVDRMAENLRRHDRKSGVGIVMSGWHIIAVAIDGSEVRHSTVLQLHDGKELRDGMLLLIHLLSPALPNPNTPWHNRPSIRQPHNIYILPDEVLRHIIHFTGHEAYLSMHLVSRQIRSICLTYPRIGHYILLSYKPNANSEAVFRVRNTSSTRSTLATLTRTKVSIGNALPIWWFSNKRYSRCVLNRGLAGTFQYHQSGIGPLNASIGEEYNNEARRYRPQRILFRDMIKKDTHQDICIQIMDGIWEMVLEGFDSIQTQGEVDQNSTGGSDLYEQMSGLGRGGIDELSEVEECYLPNSARDLSTSAE